MAEILKAVIEVPEKNTEEHSEYFRYLSWLDKVPEEINIVKDLDDHYNYWNRVSGYSKGLLNMTSYSDREKPLRECLDWDVALDSMRSGYNVGSVIRTCDGFGFRNVILGGYSPNEKTPSVRSAAMGCEQWIPLKYTDNLLEYLKERKQNEKLQVLALEITDDSSDISRIKIEKNGILILGNEERGISPDILEICSEKMNVPMYGRKYSLNVASAFAISAHHIRTAIDP